MKKNLKFIGVVESAAPGAGGFHVRRHGNRQPMIGDRLYYTPVIQQEGLSDDEIIDLATEVSRSLPVGTDSQEEIVAIVREALKLSSRKLKKKASKLLKVLLEVERLYATLETESTLDARIEYWESEKIEGRGEASVRLKSLKLLKKFKALEVFDNGKLR